MQYEWICCWCRVTLYWWNKPPSSRWKSPYSIQKYRLQNGNVIFWGMVLRWTDNPFVPFVNTKLDLSWVLSLWMKSHMPKILDQPILNLRNILLCVFVWEGMDWILRSKTDEEQFCSIIRCKWTFLTFAHNTHGKTCHCSFSDGFSNTTGLLWQPGHLLVIHTTQLTLDWDPYNVWWRQHTLHKDRQHK